MAPTYRLYTKTVNKRGVTYYSITQLYGASDSKNHKCSLVSL